MTPRHLNSLLVSVLLAACGQAHEPASGRIRGGVAEGRAVPVEVVFHDGGYRLLRGGEPYEVRGAGVEGGSLEMLAAHGGNAIRTWTSASRGPSGLHVLDEAAEHGLTVALGLDIGRERHGFDYDDRAAVAAQLERVRAEVAKYRDHPALLAWIIGNEPNLHFENPRVFDAIDEISMMIHETDGLHPTTTALAGFSAELAALIAERAPDLDFVSIQMYGDIVNLPRYIEEIGFEEPYFVTEWGAVGHWEVATTPWGAPIEQTSSEKARSYLRAWDTALEHRRQVIGSFVFLWGQKQERTPTWYGMFLADGAETAAIDAVHYAWNGVWPENRAPFVDSLTLDAATAREGVVVVPGKRYDAAVDAADPDGDRLSFRWEVMRESRAEQTGGDREEVPETLRGLLHGQAGPQVVLTAPAEPGPYRLFVYVYDGNGHAGHANLPFLVE